MVVNAPAKGQVSHVDVLKKYYEEENEKCEYDELSQIPLEVTQVGLDSIDIDYSKIDRLKLKFDEFKVEWHCLDANQHFENILNQTNFCIKDLKPAHFYSIRVSALKNNLKTSNGKLTKKLYLKKNFEIFL